MAKLVVPNDILNDTPADASPVEQNFNRIEQYINTDAVERGGSVAMTAQLKLVGDPVAPLDAASKQYVDTFLPIGIIMMFGGTGAPPGGKWAECNGAEVESAVYPDLYAVIGTRFSPAGTPAGRFNLPSLGGRVPLGAGTADAVGKTGGNRDAVIAPHTHPIDHDHPGVLSGVESTTHVHAGVNHLHNISFNTSTESEIHRHYFPGIEVQAGTSFGAHGIWNDGQVTGQDTLTSSGESTLHVHAVNGYTAPADRDLTTGGQNVNHQHAVDLPYFSGTSGAASGAVASAADANLPPFLAVTYILRVS